MNINVEEYLKRFKKEKNIPSKNIPMTKYLKSLMIRVLISVIILFSILIACKSNLSYKEIIYKEVFTSNFSFTNINNWYQKYLGGVLPFDKLFKGTTQPVFSEKLTYTNSSKYLDGVKLEVSNNYLVPIIESGIVVNISDKEGYGKIITIQGMNGVDIGYGNIASSMVNLYDYVEKGSLLGEVKENNLYLIFSKNGSNLNYEEYLN